MSIPLKRREPNMFRAQFLAGPPIPEKTEPPAAVKKFNSKVKTRQVKRAAARKAAKGG